MSLLVLNNISKEYRNRTVLNGASLRIERGERVALVGPNGAGKTTLLRIAAGAETCDLGSASIARGAKMGYLTQDLSEMDTGGGIFNKNALYHEEVSRLELKLHSLESKMEDMSLQQDQRQYDAVMAEYSRLLNRYEGMDGYTIEARIKSMLLGLGLKQEALTLPLERLSGGEKMRVALARILLEDPDLLVLDEPTNHLDIDGIEWLEGFLKRFTGGVLVISHDRYFLDQVATRVAELDNGTITERSGSYTTFMEQKERMREFARKEQFRLRQEIRHESEVALQLKGSRKISAWKSRLKTVERLQSELDVSLKAAKDQLHLYRTQAPRVAFAKAAHMSSDIAMADGLAKYYGSCPLFSDVCFHIKGGEKVGIIGPNGCGKTTLINILLGRDKDFRGSARLGEWVRYGYLDQEVEFENEDCTVLEELMKVREMMPDEARDYLARFQFYGDEADKRIAVLSGGERVRLYLGCMMLESPDCLIMDEPTNHLDVPARDALEAALTEFNGTVIAISHDRYFLNRCVGKILEFSGGTMYSFEGNYDSYRQKKLGIAPDSRTPDQPDSDVSISAGSGESRKRKKCQDRPNANSAGSITEQKPDISKIEARITELEQIQKEMENSFGPETPADDYFEYDDVIKELDGLYIRLYETIS